MQRPAFVGLAGAARARYETHYLLVHDGLAALSDGAIVGKPITVVPLSVFSARTGYYYGLRRQHGARRPRDGSSRVAVGVASSVKETGFKKRSLHLEHGLS